MRPLLVALAFVFAVAAAAAAAGPLGAQARAYRFVVDSVGDSTFVFLIGREAGWVRAGARGVAVDPRRRDALVARFRVLTVAETHATALVTGQTTFVTRDHVALLQEPPERFYKDASFWAGTVLGGLLGAVAGLLLAR